MTVINWSNGSWRFVGEMLGIFLLYYLVLIAAQIMLALCVYNDARYRGSNNAVLWAVLSGFFGIAGLVYLIVQLASKRFVVCAACYRGDSECGTAVSHLRGGVAGGLPLFVPRDAGEAAQAPFSLPVAVYRSDRGGRDSDGILHVQRIPGCDERSARISISKNSRRLCRRLCGNVCKALLLAAPAGVFCIMTPCEELAARERVGISPRCQLVV